MQFPKLSNLEYQTLQTLEKEEQAIAKASNKLSSLTKFAKRASDLSTDVKKRSNKSIRRHKGDYSAIMDKSRRNVEIKNKDVKIPVGKLYRGTRK